MNWIMNILKDLRKQRLEKVEKYTNDKESRVEMLRMDCRLALNNVYANNSLM